MITKISKKFQTTIPKKVRQLLKLDMNDLIEWEVKNNEVIIRPVSMPFLKYQASIRVGKGDILQDIEKAKELMIEKYKNVNE